MIVIFCWLTCHVINTNNTEAVNCQSKKMGKPTLYHFGPSPPSSAALLAARAANIDIEIKTIDLSKMEQLSPDFVKMNPQHTVPTLNDNGFIIWESQAIAGYLINRYGKNDSMYPKNPKLKAIVDQRLYFDATILWPRLREISFSVLFLSKTTISDEQRQALDEALGFLEMFLQGRKYLAGDVLTIADTATYATVSFLAALGWKLSRFPAVSKWLVHCRETIPGADEADVGAKMYGEVVGSRLETGQIP